VKEVVDGSRQGGRPGQRKKENGHEGGKTRGGEQSEGIVPDKTADRRKTEAPVYAEGKRSVVYRVI